MTSGSNCRHLNRPQTEDARRSIQPAYHGVTEKLQHFQGSRSNRMIRTKQLMQDLDNPVKDRLRFRKIPHFGIHTAEVTKGGRRGWMFLAERLFHDLNILLK
jgi:hypothetical protein